MVKIGLLDSGFGGLTVVSEVKRQLPGADVVFYGDNGRAPFGPLSKQIIANYTRQILDFLADQKVDVAVIACNTATAASLDEVQGKYTFPIVGVIEPGIDAALAATVTNEIGIIATKFTVDSEAHKIKIEMKRPGTRVVGQACPELVTLVEEGTLAGPKVDEAVSSLLNIFKSTNIDTLVLGCTHFPALMDSIANYLGPTIGVIDPAQQTVAEVKNLLAQKGLAADNPTPVYRFCTSGDPDRFAQVGSSILGWPVNDVEKIVLG